MTVQKPNPVENLSIAAQPWPDVQAAQVCTTDLRHQQILTSPGPTNPVFGHSKGTRGCPFLHMGG